MTFKEFLKNYAEKFPEGIKDVSKFVNNVNNIYIDFADGVFSFNKEDYARHRRKIKYICGGGSNSYLDNDKDYRYLWDNLIEKNTEFIQWMKDHNITQDDLMEIEISFDNTYLELSKSEIRCSFYFYGRLFEIK